MSQRRNAAISLRVEHDVLSFGRDLSEFDKHGNLLSSLGVSDTSHRSSGLIDVTTIQTICQLKIGRQHVLNRDEEIRAVLNGEV